MQKLWKYSLQMSFIYPSWKQPLYLPSGNFSPKKLFDLQNWQTEFKFHGYIDEY